MNKITLPSKLYPNVAFQTASLEFYRIPMEIKVNRFVLCEKSFKISVGKCMRMRAFCRQDHEVGNIHDADAEAGVSLRKRAAAAITSKVTSTPMPTSTLINQKLLEEQYFVQY